LINQLLSKLFNQSIKQYTYL